MTSDHSHDTRGKNAEEQRPSVWGAASAQLDDCRPERTSITKDNIGTSAT